MAMEHKIKVSSEWTQEERMKFIRELASDTAARAKELPTMEVGHRCELIYFVATPECYPAETLEGYRCIGEFKGFLEE